jgi:hypothetical protein
VAELQAGNIVTIYEDPITETKPEGEARLVEFVRDDGDMLEFWFVHFSGDHISDRHQRAILKPDTPF